MKKGRIDYSQVDIEKILNYFNVQNINIRRKEIQFSCPFPEHIRGDKNPSSSVNIEDGRWHCFSCGRSGRIENLVAELEGISLAVAIRWVRESYKGRIKDQVSLKEEFEQAIRKKTKKKEITIPEEFIDIFRVNWDRAFKDYKKGSLPKRLQYPFKRGLSPETLEKFEIGYDKKSTRITIPIRNEKGKLVGFKGRTTDYETKPKYLSIGDKQSNYYGFETHKNSNYVFGIFSADPNVIVCEGEFDVMSLRQKGFNGAIAIGGSNPTETQIKIIIKNAEFAILMLDPDEAGKKAERILSDSLLGFIPVRIAELNELKGKDPAELNSQEIQELIHNSKQTIKI